jgi:hypothetical protein
MPLGVIALADAVPDMGAISSINLLKNRIPVEQAQELVQIMHTKEKLITLCGLSKEETELDFSGQDLDAGDAVLIANDISDMGALTSLNLADNKIGAHYDSDRNKIVATPKGTPCAQLHLSCALIRSLCRPCCYRQCHQEYGGTIIAESCK